MSLSSPLVAYLGEAAPDEEKDEDMEEKEILAEAGRTDGNSLWKRKKRDIEGRKSKWLERFATALTEDDILPAVLSREEQRIERMRETGWEPSQVRPEKVPAAPVQTRMDQIPKYKALAAVTYLCYKCWRSVPVGVDRISCKLCNVVAHRKCIPDLSKYAVSSQVSTSKPTTAVTSQQEMAVPASRMNTSLQERMKTHPDVILYNRVKAAIDSSAQFTNTLYGTNMGDKLLPRETTDGDYKSQKLSDISLNEEAFPGPGGGGDREQASGRGRRGECNDNGGNRVSKWSELAEFAEQLSIEKEEESEEEQEFDEAAEELEEANEMIMREIKAARKMSPPGSQGRTIITLADVKKSAKVGVGGILSPMALKRMNSRKSLNSAGSDVSADGLGSQRSQASIDAADGVSEEARAALNAIAAVQSGLTSAPRLTKSSRNMNSRAAKLDLNVCKVVWKCPFCVEEVVAYNKHYLNNFEKVKHDNMVLKAVLKMQSFSRMVPIRVEFLTAKFGIIHAQRKFRSRLFWLKMAADTMNIPRPFRLKVHDILLIYRNADAQLSVYPRDLSTDKVQIGQMMASVYPAYSMYEALGKDVPKNHKDILKLLMGDSFNDGTGQSTEVALYSSTFNKAAIVSRNDLFLTVCIAESRPDGDQRQAKQYYRFDLPIRQSGKAVKMTPLRLEMLGCSNMSEMSKYDLDMIQENYKIIPYNLARPYILLPSCSRNSTVKITLSEVGEWPKSTCLGQATDMINNYLMWKKIVSTRQGFLKCAWNDLPVADEMSKLDVRLPAKIKHFNLPGIKPRERAKKKEHDNQKDSDSLSVDVDGDDDVSIGSMESQGTLASIATTNTAMSTRRRAVDPNDVQGLLAKRERALKAQGMSGSALMELQSPAAANNSNQLASLKSPGLKSPNGKGGGLKSPGNAARQAAGAVGAGEGSKEFVKEYVAGSVTWSLLSVSYDGCDYAGFMYFLVMASVHSAKKKCWCIMIDGVMMTFSSITDLKTKESIDLRYCHIQELSEGVIELIYVKEQPQKIWYYVLAPSTKERTAWLSKFYQLSMYTKDKQAAPPAAPAT